MRDQSHLVAIACYGVLLLTVLPALQTRDWTAAGFLPFLVLFAYAFVRLKWQLPNRIDDAFENAAPLAFLVSIAIVIVAMTAKSMSWI